MRWAATAWVLVAPLQGRLPAARNIAGKGAVCAFALAGVDGAGGKEPFALSADLDVLCSEPDAQSSVPDERAVVLVALLEVLSEP